MNIKKISDIRSLTAKEVSEWLKDHSATIESPCPPDEEEQRFLYDLWAKMDSQTNHILI
jgi:hypothetical protein